VGYSGDGKKLIAQRLFIKSTRYFDGASTTNNLRLE